MYNQSTWNSGSGVNIIAEPNCCIRVLKKRYDAITNEAIHNDLTTAAYLARAGKSVLVLKCRHLMGGTAVSEVIDPEEVTELEVALVDIHSITSRIQSRIDQKFDFKEDVPVLIGRRNSWSCFN